jgi:hypothetical protein
VSRRFLLVAGVALFACDDPRRGGVTVYPIAHRDGQIVAERAETFYAVVEAQDVLTYDGNGQLVSLTKDRGLACKVAGQRDWECSQCGAFGTRWKCHSYAMRGTEMSSRFYDVPPPEYVAWWRWRLLRIRQREW